MKSLIIFLLSASLAPSFGQTPVNDPNWQLDATLSDEFTAFNNTKWYKANDFDHYGEKQVYTNRPTNVYIESGNLVLEMHDDGYTCTNLSTWACARSYYTYTSGWVESTFNFQY